MKARIAVASDGDGGLEGRVHDKLARAPIFVLVDVEDCRIVSVRALSNPAPTFSHGAGPIAVKTLMDAGATVLVGPAPGESVSSLLEEHGIMFVEAQPGEPLRKALEKAMKLLGC